MNKKFTYKNVVKYFFVFATMFLFTRSIGVEVPLNLSLLSAFAYLGFSPLITSVCFVCSYAVTFNLEYIVKSLFPCVIVSAVAIVYGRLKKKPKIGLPFFVLLTCSLYLYENFSTETLIYSALIVLVTIVCISAIRTVFINGFKVKATKEELLSVGVASVFIGLGIINLLGVNVWKFISLYVLLVVARTFGYGTTAVVATVLSVPVAISVRDASVIGVYAVWAVAMMSTPIFKPLPAILAVFADYCMFYAFGIYDVYTTTDLAFMIGSACAFTFTPNKLLDKFSEKALAFKDKKLVKNSIMRNRTLLSSRLYEVASAFKEMQNCLYEMKNVVPDENTVKANISSAIKNKVCSSCMTCEKCRQKNFPDDKILSKLLDVGINKGRISFVDLPKEFTDSCGYPNGMLYEINAEINAFKEVTYKLQDATVGRELVSMQAGGLADAIKNMAFDMSRILPYNDKLQQKLYRALAENGVVVNELLVIGDDDEFEISLTLNEEVLQDEKFLSVLSKTSGKNLSVTQKTVLSETVSAITVKPSPVYDACFGVAKKNKDGSDVSGDTYSLTKINEGKFLVALNDGMGSGENANKISSTAISLIETFYKAGLKTDVILGTVNKLMSFGEEDTFTALDVAVISLYDGYADFIKIGAPFGFVLSNNGIKIIEGSSLPLGILDSVDVSSCGLSLAPESTLILMSDGVTDAFGSSADALEFIKVNKCLNPQFLADKILKEAERLENGKPQDDFTVICVRLYER